MVILVEAINDVAAEIERQNRIDARRRKQAAAAAFLLLRRKQLLASLEVAAFAVITNRGALTIPVPVYPGDTLYLQPPYAPRAGTISRDPAGQSYAVALGAIAAGKISLVRAELLEKAWRHGSVCKTGPCDDCAMNAAAGWIPADKWFPSGVSEPRQHPNCDCWLEVRRYAPVPGGSQSS